MASLRRGLRARLERAPKKYGETTYAEAKQLRPSDTHARGAAKEIEAQNMQRALRIRPDYEEGQAFDPAWQERRKLERIEAREQRRAEAEARAHLPQPSPTQSRRASRWDHEERNTSSYRDASYSPPRGRCAVSYEDVHASPRPPTSLPEAHSRTPSPPPTTAG